LAPPPPPGCLNVTTPSLSRHPDSKTKSLKGICCSCDQLEQKQAFFLQETMCSEAYLEVCRVKMKVAFLCGPSTVFLKDFFFLS
jgi:hypothetical protein